MKKSLFRFAVLLLAAVFLMTTIACEQPGTPEIPPSSEDKPNIWDIQSVAIYNWNDNETYKTGNDVVITTEPENIFHFYPVTYPDIDAADQSEFSWSLTDSEGNPSNAATLTPGEGKGLLILTTVYVGNCTLTLTSKVNPELSCSVAIVIEEPAEE